MTSPPLFDTRALTSFANATTEKAVVAERYKPTTPSPAARPAPDAGWATPPCSPKCCGRCTRCSHILDGGRQGDKHRRRPPGVGEAPRPLYEHPEMGSGHQHALPGRPGCAPDDAPVPGRTSCSWEVLPTSSPPRPGAEVLADDWEVTTSAKTGNPMYVHPAVVSSTGPTTSLSSAPDPRSRRPEHDLDRCPALPAAAPLERRSVTSSPRCVAAARWPPDRDPRPGALALEIIRQVWPDENPFIHGAKEITDEPAAVDDPGLEVPRRRRRQVPLRDALPLSEGSEHIGTSWCWRPGTPPMSPRSTRSASAGDASGAWEDAVRRVRRRAPHRFEDEAHGSSGDREVRTGERRPDRGGAARR